jgi:hypothetical protein
MRIQRLVVFAVATVWISGAALAKTAIILPVAPGIPGGGPWTVEEWPVDGCSHCSIDRADLLAVGNLLADIIKQGREIAPGAKIPVHVVRGGEEDRPSSLVELRKALADCKLGSVGMLSPNSTTGLVAYGARIDCTKTRHSSFMSIVLGKEHAPVAVYWLPDRPILALDTH